MKRMTEENKKRLALIILTIEENGGRTFKQCGEKFGFTAERARQLYRLAVHMKQRGELPCCNSCIYPMDGVCNNCDGENFGHSTEVSGRGFCKNWKGGKNDRGREKYPKS